MGISWRPLPSSYYPWYPLHFFYLLVICLSFPIQNTSVHKVIPVVPERVGSSWTMLHWKCKEGSSPRQIQGKETLIHSKTWTKLVILYRLSSIVCYGDRGMKPYEGRLQTPVPPSDRRVFRRYDTPSSLRGSISSGLGWTSFYRTVRSRRSWWQTNVNLLWWPVLTGLLWQGLRTGCLCYCLSLYWKQRNSVT